MTDRRKRSYEEELADSSREDAQCEAQDGVYRDDRTPGGADPQLAEAQRRAALDRRDEALLAYAQEHGTDAAEKARFDGIPEDDADLPEGNDPAEDPQLHQPPLAGIDVLDPIPGDRMYGDRLLEGLYGELEDAPGVEAAARALSDERAPKTSDAEAWWAHFVGYLRGVLDVVTGESTGTPLQPVRALSVTEEAITLIASIAQHGGPEVARRISERRLIQRWAPDRAYLEGAREALEIESAVADREVAADRPNLAALLEAAGEDAWYAALGRAMVADAGYDVGGVGPLSRAARQADAQPGITRPPGIVGAIGRPA